MTIPKLNKLEETVTSLAAYLIAAPAQHPKHLLGSHSSSLTEVKSAKLLRLTQHHTAALLAYGFPPTADELKRTADWFATPFPRADHDEIDQMEMTKLEALLNLRPDDPSVPARLTQLVAQRSNDLFELAREDGQGADPVFDTLWSLKLLLMARSRGILGKQISDAQLKRSLLKVLQMSVRDKDIALALRLHHELPSQRARDTQDALSVLVRHAQEYGGVWGISNANKWERARAMIESMQRRVLTPTIIGAQEKLLRDVILDTCYVIENLMPLAAGDPALNGTLQNAMELWWRQIQGEDAPRILRALFSDDYDFLTVLFRTMVAVNHYIGEPLGAHFWMVPLRALSQRYSEPESQEMKNIRRALRRWIGVKIEKSSQLKLGLSEANVARIKPAVYNPTDMSRRDMLNTTLIVKYGPVEEIENERKNYQSLPGRIQGAFVRIPKPSYIYKRQQAFVIMEDLSEYFTLFELYDKLLKDEKPRLIGALSEFLIHIHRGDGSSLKYSTTNHFRDLYVLPMLQQIDFIAGYMQNAKEMLNGEIEGFDGLERAISDAIAGVMRQQERFGPFPLAYMHGDLHTRNVMVRVLSKPGTTRSSTDLEFKLIDLESLRPDGDAAHDAGQLLVDLDLLPVSSRVSLPRNVFAKLELLRSDLEAAYLSFAAERGDDNFAARLSLAKSRALIRIAKGLSKRSYRALNNRDYQQASVAASEIFQLVDSARLHLDNVHL